MNRCLLAAILLSLACNPSMAQTPAVHQVKLNGHTFTLPAGFEIELAAGPPLVERPITADFDEQGRLYVSDSSGSNEKLTVQLEKKPHRIVRLEDTTGTGKFERRTIFADKMMFPEGTMWHAGSLYVAAPPSIWKLTDTDGDGVADQRVEWFKGKTLTGCGNDLHGPYLGPDGWIYWCKGAFAQQEYQRPGKKPLKTRASHIFRARPDGSGLEHVMTGGMDNPVDLVFTPGGERIFTTTFLQFPGGGKRDGLIHAVYGGVYGKDWDVNYDHPWTGPGLMPPMTHLGAAAPSGLHRYESDVFGKDYQDNLFTACFNLQKITRHVLEPDGSTFKTKDFDFLVSDNKDFHPTDVIEDADGSLLVIDTGGWYKLCCPTSQLVKPDVLGAIYRVKKAGGQRIDDPRGLKLNWKTVDGDSLANLLDDPRPAVRRRAIEKLVRDGDLPKMLPGQSTLRRRNLVWAATRFDNPQARAIVRQALHDEDESVRQAALHSISLHRDREAVQEVLRLALGLGGFGLGATRHNQRAAAEALGRIGDDAVIGQLVLKAAEFRLDRCLEHSLIYALIELDRYPETSPWLKNQHAHVRRVALIALDQMPSSRLRASDVAPALTDLDPNLREAAWWIASRHPEWGPELGKSLHARLTNKSLSADEQTVLTQQLAKLARSPAIQAVLAERLSHADAGASERRLVLKAMAQARLKETPASWFAGIEQILSGGDAELISTTLTTMRSLPALKKMPASLTASLAKLAQDDQQPAEIRLYSLAIVPVKLSSTQFALVQKEIKAERPVANRALAAEILAQAPFSKTELLSLVQSLPDVGPMELHRLLEAFAQSSDDEVGRRLLAALERLPTKSALRNDRLKQCLAKFGPEVRKEAEKLYAALDAETGKQQARLELLLADLEKAEKGDVRRGQAVFNHQKNACASCHAIGYLGGNVGPDLTHIGRIRTERDLLEAIVFPSASFVRGYEPVQVTTKAGKVVSGILKRDDAQEVLLVLGANQEVVIARADIEEIHPGRVSIMPSGLDQQMTLRDLADLVAFLRACK